MTKVKRLEKEVITMKNKTIVIVALVSAMIFVANVLGLRIGMSVDAQARILDSHKSKIEMQLARYKDAQEVCGRDNVEEVEKYVEARFVETGDYTCESFKEAAKTLEEREVDKEHQVLVGQYSDYRHYGGTLSFDDWKKVTKK